MEKLDLSKIISLDPSFSGEGETVRKLKIEQIKPQNIAINNINNNKMMWSENLKKEFSDRLGGVA